ncbi:hypothetical protein Bca4012_044622 [Brassica carinata]
MLMRMVGLLFPYTDLMQREKMRSLIGFQTMWNFQMVTPLICVTVSTERKESLLTWKATIAM